MIDRARNSCAVFQAALVDFADRPARTAGTAAALAHLERCRSCEDELAGIVRTIAGLRTLARNLDGVEPAPESWPLLRARVSHRKPSPWRWSYSLGGVIATAAIALLVLPSIGSSPVRQPTEGDIPAVFSPIDRREEAPSAPIVRAPRAARAGPEELPRTVRWPASGSSRMRIDGEPVRPLAPPETGSAGSGSTSIRRTPTAPNPSTRRPGPGHRIDAI